LIEEDPNLEVLKDLDIEMGRTIKIHSIVSEALEVVYVTARVLEAQKRSHAPAGVVVDRAIDIATRKIMKIFRNENKNEG
jgi:hypothetical protein